MEIVQEAEMMKLLAVIRDEDVGLISKKSGLTKKRSAARTILIKGKTIALLNVTKDKHHKLPGGGLEGREKIKEALYREILEETGCKIKIIGEVGKIMEYRSLFDLIQTSFCYIATVVKEGKPQFDEGERKAGFKLEWIGMNSAMKLLKKEKPATYDGKFIIIRDLKFIEAAKKLITPDKR